MKPFYVIIAHSACGGGFIVQGLMYIAVGKVLLGAAFVVTGGANIALAAWYAGLLSGRARQ